MHMVIRAIVFSNNEENALDEAKRIFEDLVENGYFDYYVTFDDHGSGVAGRSRWGNLPVVTKIDSPEGKKLAEGGLMATRKEFMRHISAMRNVIENFSDEEIWIGERTDDVREIADALKGDKMKLERNMRMFRYYSYCVGQYRGPSIYLYDNDGKGIRDIGHYNRVINKWKTLYDDMGKETPYKDLNIYIVPADVHY